MLLTQSAAGGEFHIVEFFFQYHRRVVLGKSHSIQNSEIRKEILILVLRNKL